MANCHFAGLISVNLRKSAARILLSLNAFYGVFAF
jgi:hypothetical protein